MTEGGGSATRSSLGEFIEAVRPHEKGRLRISKREEKTDISYVSMPGFSLDTPASIMDNISPRKSRAILGNDESPGFLLNSTESVTLMLSRTGIFRATVGREIFHTASRLSQEVDRVEWGRSGSREKQRSRIPPIRLDLMRITSQGMAVARL